jgi:soluble cytochrome b562
MRNRIVTGACLVFFIGGTALAADDKAEQQCVEQLAQAEALVDQKVEAKALSESDVEEVNMLLDEADALCTEGSYKEASQTLSNVSKLVSTPPAE